MTLASLLTDWFRYFTLVVASVTAAIVGVVAVIHYRRWREAAGHWYGAKPAHVWEVSVGYLLALGGLSAYTVTLVHQPFEWFASPVLLASCAFTLHALWRMTTFLGSVRNLPTDENPEPLSDAQRARVLLRGLSIVAIPLAFISLIPSLVGFYRTQKLITENGSRIHEIQVLRHQASINIRQSQIRQCNATNTITKRDRATILAGPKAAIPILRAVGFTEPQIAAYEKKAIANAKQEIKNRPLLAGGNCAKLVGPLHSPKPKP